MSEIQRYKAREINDTGRWFFWTHPQGELCRYADLLWYKRKWIIEMAISGFFIIACAVLVAFLVHEKAARGPVAVPMGAGEKAELLQENSALQKEKEAIQKQRDDQIKLNANYRAQIKALNAKEGSHVAQLEALQARGREIDRLNHEQAQRMSTNQGLVLEAKTVLGVENVQIVDR